MWTILILFTARHRASTSMYSLIFRVRVTTPPHYGRNGTAHAAGASILSLARGVFASIRSAWHSVRRAVGLADCRWALPRISSVVIATQPVHRLQNANPPNSAQLGGIPYHSPKLHPGSCNSVGMRPRTDRHTDRLTHRRAWPQDISRRLRLTRNVMKVTFETHFKHNTVFKMLDLP